MMPFVVAGGESRTTHRESRVTELGVEGGDVEIMVASA